MFFLVFERGSPGRLEHIEVHFFLGFVSSSAAMDEDELIEAALAYDMQLEAAPPQVSHQWASAGAVQPCAPRQGESTLPDSAMASSPGAAQALQVPAMDASPEAPLQAAEALQEPAMVSSPCAPGQADAEPARKRLRGKQQPRAEALQEHAVVPWSCPL